MPKKNWSQQEIDLLLDLYKTKSASQISVLMNRSQNSVRNKLAALTGSAAYQGDDPDIQTTAPWTEEDMAKLRELAASGKKYPQIAKELGRTVGAVRAKVFAHKIIVYGAEKREWTEEEDEYLRENWGQTSLASMCKALHRTDVAVKQRACSVLQLGRADELTDYVKIAEFVDLSGISRDRILYTLVPKYKFPIVKKVVLRNRQYFIDLAKVLKWMEKNQRLYDGSRVSQDLFVQEPQWLAEKRRQDRENKANVNSYAIVKIWTPNDLLRLKDLVRIGYNYTEIAREFGVTRSQIEHRVIQENLSYTSPTFWQGSDFKFLRENWQTMTDEELAAHLHKSKLAVIKQRNKQGYLRMGEKRRYTTDEEQFVKEHWEQMSDEEMSKQMGRSVAGVKNLRYKLGLKREQAGGSY